MAEITTTLWDKYDGKGFAAEYSKYSDRASADETGNSLTLTVDAGHVSEIGGNPIDAEHASKDGDGNVITATYAVKSEIPSNLPAAKGGTTSSLVTTGDKYAWNDWKSVNIQIPLPKDTIEVNGHLFKYVQIGNLLVTTTNLDIPLGTVGDTCFWYNDDEDTNRDLGMLYKWNALGTLVYVSGGYYRYQPTQEIVDCIHSQGWRVWTDSDVDYIRNQHSGEDQSDKNTNMCSASGWLNGSQGTNELGLNLIPSGERHWDGKSYQSKGYDCVIRYTPASLIYGQNYPQPEWFKPGYYSIRSGDLNTGASIRLVKDVTV